MNEHYDIFISYRRLDVQGNISGRDQARLIAKQLELEGFRSFFDYSEIKDNEFDKVIIPAVENCKVFILVLTKDALCRCKNEDDWVRREIETAINSHCKIINVSPDNSFNGWPNTLPESLVSIKNIQISEISMGSLFELSVKKLINERIISGLNNTTFSTQETNPAYKSVNSFTHKKDKNPERNWKRKLLSFSMKVLKLIEILLLLFSVIIFISFAVLDIGYNNHSIFVPYYEWFLGAYSIYMVLALIGYARPAALLCTSRTWVTVFFLIPFILLAIVGGNVMEEYENGYKEHHMELSLMPSNNYLDLMLTKQMLGFYFGNPKMVTESSSNMPQQMVVKFDKSGRVISKQYGNVKNIYLWNTKEGKIECKGYNADKFIGSTIIYLHEMSDKKYVYEANGVQYEVLFRENGSLDKATAMNNGQSMGSIYYYKTSKDMFPYRSVMSGGGQSITMDLSGIETDSLGNAITVVKTSLGQSDINTTSIEYY